jgi:3-phosphoshikimate 1-carboxyvinyltransferase
MKATIEPGFISGNISVPPSKSMTQRAFAGALLHKGKTIIHNSGNSEDELAALDIIQQLGAKVIADSRGFIEIESNGVIPVSDTINCGESGLAARLFIPIAALSNTPITITGTGSLLYRPMGLYTGLLPELNVTISNTGGHLPVHIKGPLIPLDIAIDGSDSSQFLSGILFAFCYAQAQLLITIKVHELKSKPYIDMTLDVLKKFGHSVSHNDYTEFYLHSTSQKIDDKVIDITIDGDWSSAAFFLVAGAIAGEFVVSGLTDNQLQADSALLTVLKEVGAEVSVTDNIVTVRKDRLFAFEFDATDCPDLFPILAILAACCKGESYIKGVHRLFSKESNRAESISEMLENFGVSFSLEDDSLCITGGWQLQGTVIDSYHDHRIAMAAAIGALKANGPVDILHAEAVSKSYPEFFKTLALCGGKCNFID